MKIIFITFLLFTSMSYSQTNETYFSEEKIIKYNLKSNIKFKQLNNLIKMIDGKKDMYKLNYVNKFFNFIRYSSDLNTYKKVDHWTNIYEMLSKNKGDCEDYSIAKYQLLTKIGFNKNKFSFAIGDVDGYNEKHMVLLYKDKNNTYVLDNMYKRIKNLEDRKDFKIDYIFTEDEILNKTKFNSKSERFRYQVLKYRWKNVLI